MEALGDILLLALVLTSPVQHLCRVTCLQFAGPGPHGKLHLVSAGADRSLKLWQADTGHSIKTPKKPPADTVSAAVEDWLHSGHGLDFMSADMLL